MKNTEREKNGKIIWLIVLCLAFALASPPSSSSLSGSSQSGYYLVAVMPSIGASAGSQENIESRVEAGISIPAHFSFVHMLNNYSGNIGLLEYFYYPEQQGSLSHTINLVTPQNMSGFYGNSATFRFSVSNPASLDNCSLLLDGDEIHLFMPVFSGINNHTESGISEGIHSWMILCADQNGNTSASHFREFLVFPDISDDNESTNLSGVDITNVTNFTISKSAFGKVVFKGSTDISGLSNLGSNIRIGDKSIFVNVSALGILNKSAELTFKNIAYQNPTVLKDGAPCSSCTISSFSGNVLVINVSGFSNYSVTSNSKLDIYDDTDFSGKVVNETIYFFANYTNVSSGQALPATCQVSFDLSGWTLPVSMLFNGSSGVYYYNRTFVNAGAYTFNVSCVPSGPGSDALSLTDAFTVSYISNMAGSFASLNLSAVSSSRFNATYSSYSDSGAGNVSEVRINITSVSDSWQGYYGNISAKISLKDESGYVFYEWSNSSVRGQIFSSRSSNVAWSTINCSNSTSLDNENLFIEKTLSDSDGIYSTFSYTNHPPFFIGDRYIVNCRSTRLNGPSGPSDDFWNIVLADNDGGSNMVYAGFINASSQGFNNMDYNFQIIVSENGKSGANSITPYYFYIELE